MVAYWPWQKAPWGHAGHSGWSGSTGTGGTTVSGDRNTLASSADPPQQLPRVCVWVWNTEYLIFRLQKKVGERYSWVVFARKKDVLTVHVFLVKEREVVCGKGDSTYSQFLVSCLTPQYFFKCQAMVAVIGICSTEGRAQCSPLSQPSPPPFLRLITKQVVCDAYYTKIV